MSLHISAPKDAIASVVLMPGDPLRAKYIAENWLTEIELVNTTRNVFFYTGFYKEKKITVGASGMGCPSIGIYSYELFKEYDVQCIIRIGTAGSYYAETGLYELINVDHACSESTYAKFAFENEQSAIPHQGNAFNIINDTARQLGIAIKAGNIHSSDIFYRKKSGIPAIALANNCHAVEMEAFALFANAAELGKMAATILTISDVIPTGEHISPADRERSLNPMITLALETAIKLS